MLVVQRTAVTVSRKDLVLKERGTKIHPGINVKKGSDDTLFAVVDGKVKFERVGKDKKQVSVYEIAE